MNDLNLMVAETTKEITHPCGTVTTESTREVYYDGRVVERGGYSFRVNFPQDDDHEPPWEDGDGQGIVSAVGTIRPKKPGERVLTKDGRHSRIYFDWQGTIQKAKSESWGLSTEEFDKLTAKLGKLPTHNQVIEQAVERNFQWMRRWVRGDWEYVGVTVTLLDRKGSELFSETSWGYDTDDMTDLASVVNEMIDETLGILDAQRKEQEAKDAEQAQLHTKACEAVANLANAIVWSHYSDSFKEELYRELDLLAERAGVPVPRPQ